MSGDNSETLQGKLTINGTALADNNPENIFGLIRSCPHAIKDENRHRVNTPIAYANTSGRGWEIEQEAYRVDYNSDPENISLRQTRIDLYLQAAEAFAHENQPIAQANNLSLTALEWMDFPQLRSSSGELASEKAVTLFQQANAIHEQLGNYDHLYRDTERLYSMALKTVRAYRDSGDTAMAEKYYAVARETMEKLPDIAARMQGPADASAYPISEGEIGYSDKEPIGTYNTSQCLVLIAQPNRPHTQKLQDSVVGSYLTGIVHIDHETDLSTLNRFFTKFPEGPIRMRVLGARFQGDAIAYENVHRIISALRKTGRDIDIISADVEGGNAGPSAVVVNPETFELEEAVPTKADPNKDISNAMPLFYKQGKPLTVAVDLAQSHEYAPVLLDRDRVAMLRNEYLGHDLVGINDSMLKSPHILDDYGLSAHYIDGLCKAYMQSYEVVEKALEKKIAEIRAKYPDFGEEPFETARELLRTVPVYVGGTIENANQSVVDAIENVFEDDGKGIKLHPESLAALELPPYAYEVFSSRSQGFIGHTQGGGGKTQLRS